MPAIERKITMQQFAKKPHAGLLVALGGAVILAYIVGILLEGLWGPHSVLFFVLIGLVIPQKTRPLLTAIAIFFSLFTVLNEKFYTTGLVLLLALLCAGSTIMQNTKYARYTLPMLVLAAASYALTGGISLGPQNWIAYSFFACAITASLRSSNHLK